jgi:hypothetical protein
MVDKVDKAVIQSPSTSLLDKLTSAQRKTFPIARGLLDYFPDACAAIGHVSFIGNEQHNKGEPMHWARGKSTDHADCIVRHLTQRGTIDSDGIPHSWKLAWRALALVQLEIEAGVIPDFKKP